MLRDLVTFFITKAIINSHWKFCFESKSLKDVVWINLCSIFTNRMYKAFKEECVFKLWGYYHIRNVVDKLYFQSRAITLMQVIKGHRALNPGQEQDIWHSDMLTLTRHSVDCVKTSLYSFTVYWRCLKCWSTGKCIHFDRGHQAQLLK